MNERLSPPMMRLLAKMQNTTRVAPMFGLDLNVVAKALRTRNLIDVTSNGGRYITRAGRAALENGHYNP